MPKTIKGFFFDLDGTLVDTEQANFEAYRTAIKEITNVDISKEDFKRTHGMVYRDFLPFLVPGIQTETIESVSARKKELYAELMHLTKANVFLVDFLRNITADHVTVLVTTAKKHNGKTVLREHGLLSLFDHIIYGDDVEHMKPHPEAYLLALKKSMLRSDEVIAFEDSQVGIRAATAAKISTIHIRSFL